jgi:hypothetical protein
MIAMSGMCMHCACHLASRMFARFVWLLMRMLMGVSVIHVVLVSPPRNRMPWGRLCRNYSGLITSSTPELAA